MNLAPSSPPTPRATDPLPDYAFELPDPSPDDKVEAVTVARVRGWKLPNGTVLCRTCCRKPAGAVPATLIGDGDSLCWEESAAETANVPPGDGGAPADDGADLDDADAEESADDDKFGKF